jgi:hypothetical protein
MVYFKVNGLFETLLLLCNVTITFVWWRFVCRSQWPRGLRRGSAAARLLRSWARIPPGAWMFVCCECCMLSGRGLCDGLITRPEESYRLWCVVVCDLETSSKSGPWPTGGCCAKRKKEINKERKRPVSANMHLNVITLQFL